ncbi:MAG TPA: hypothetical protein VLX28_08190 [Thermoanaerobaculia bacterium]|nr:hypothetical protein [Thermoanaerobaculia bacterium]
MTNSDIDLDGRYAEGCNALRHYSSTIMNVRTLAIAQGFTVVGAAGYLLRQGEFNFSLGVSVFGILFTGLLYSLQRNYWLHCKAFLGYVIEVEGFMDKVGAHLAAGPWSTYDKERRERHRRWRWSISAVHGPFLLLLLALVLITTYDILAWVLKRRTDVLTTAHATLFAAIAGAAISLMASLLKDLWPVSDHQQPSRPVRRTGLLITVTLLGTVVAIVAAIMQFRGTSEATQQFDFLHKDVTKYGLVVDATGKIIGQPNDILRGNYSVRIAAGGSPQELLPFAQNLRTQFPAIDPKHVCIVDTEKVQNPKTRYHLFFGRGVNFTSAALLHTLALNSKFTPQNEDGTPQPPALEADESRRPCLPQQ